VQPVLHAEHEEVLERPGRRPKVNDRATVGLEKPHQVGRALLPRVSLLRAAAVQEIHDVVDLTEGRPGDEASGGAGGGISVLEALGDVADARTLVESEDVDPRTLAVVTGADEDFSARAVLEQVCRKLRYDPASRFRKSRCVRPGRSPFALPPRRRFDH
jgi:hypothetical protein